MTVLPLDANMDEGLPIRAAIFYGIADEILEYLLQVHPMHRKRGQRISADFCPAFRNGAAQVSKGAVQSFVRIGGFAGSVEFCHLRIGQEVAYQHLHARRAAMHEGDELPRLLVDGIAMTLCQEFTVNLDAAQGLLEIVGRGECELLKIPVGAPHLFLHAHALGYVIVRFQYTDQIAFWVALGNPARKSIDSGTSASYVNKFSRPV